MARTRGGVLPLTPMKLLAVFPPLLSLLVPSALWAQSNARLARLIAGEETPKNAADLRLMQEHRRKILNKVMPSVVSIGGAAGVIVEGGYVLSAGHVTSRPGRTLVMRTNDGRRVTGRTLGLNKSRDSGLIKITSEGSFPALQLGKSRKLERGEWVLMLGFPGGRKRGLLPPLRVGRFLRTYDKFLVSDCTMSAGDSGGPLLDMEGNVIGINSRIARDLAMNMHVPIDSIKSDWARLVRGDVIGGRPIAFLGVEQQLNEEGAVITKVVENSGAAKAKLQAGDVILRFGGSRPTSRRDLPALVRRRRPGERIRLEVMRDGREIEIDVVLGRRAVVR